MYNVSGITESGRWGVGGGGWGSRDFSLPLFMEGLASEEGIPG